MGFRRRGRRGPGRRAGDGRSAGRSGAGSRGLGSAGHPAEQVGAMLRRALPRRLGREVEGGEGRGEEVGRLREGRAFESRRQGDGAPIGLAAPHAVRGDAGLVRRRVLGAGFAGRRAGARDRWGPSAAEAERRDDRAGVGGPAREDRVDDVDEVRRRQVAGVGGRRLERQGAQDDAKPERPEPPAFHHAIHPPPRTIERMCARAIPASRGTFVGLWTILRTLSSDIRRRAGPKNPDIRKNRPRRPPALTHRPVAISKPTWFNRSP